MTKSTALLLILSALLTASCAFNSVFFAVEKQDLNSKITDLEYEEFYSKSDDGTEVYCTFFNSDEKAQGTIFFLQGSGDNVASWSGWARPFVKEGYQVFMMEYRGFGAASGKATHKNVLKDAQISFIKMTNLEAVKGKKVLVLGQSYGGQIAINLTSRFQDKVDALVIEGTFTTFNEEVVYQVPLILKPFLGLLTTSHYKSKNLIREIKGVPVLIIHSSEDTTVPIKMGRKLYANANSPKYFWEIDGEHIHGIEDHTKEYIDRIKMLTVNSSYPD